MTLAHIIYIHEKIKQAANLAHNRETVNEMFSAEYRSNVFVKWKPIDIYFEKN